MLLRSQLMMKLKNPTNRLIKKYHPDVSKEDDKGNFFILITKAYSVLKDEKSRAEYDEHIRTDKKSQSFLKFQYTFYDFIKKQGELFNTFRIFFKNISGEKTNKFIKDDFFSWQEKIQKEVLKMPIKELEERLLYSDNPFVRLNAAIALGYKAEKSSYNSLEKILTEPNNEIKKGAIWAIGNLKMKKSLGLLKILFDSGPNDVKIEVLKAVYKIEEGKGIEFYKIFVSSLNDGDNELKKEALKLLLATDKKVLFDDIKKIFKQILMKLDYC